MCFNFIYYLNDKYLGTYKNRIEIAHGTVAQSLIQYLLNPNCNFCTYKGMNPHLIHIKTRFNNYNNCFNICQCVNINANSSACSNKCFSLWLKFYSFCQTSLEFPFQGNQFPCETKYPCRIYFIILCIEFDISQFSF